jgi:prepilin-type processing-associated H-X9-DG protein
VELLTVVAILVILVSVSMPAVARFIESGKEAATASRLRQVHALQMAYAADNNGQLTSFWTSANKLTWQERLLPYLNIINKAGAKEDPKLVLNSPYQTVEEGKPFWQQGRSFGLNNFMDDARWKFRLSQVAEPARIILAGDMEQGNTDLMNTSDGKNWWGGSASWGLPAYRHRGKSRAMMLFMDGHTELLTEEELKLEPAGRPSLWRWWK